MKESLESARNIHQILIALCAALSIFIISKKSINNPFDLALSEVETLKTVFQDTLKFSTYQGVLEIRDYVPVDKISHKIPSEFKEIIIDVDTSTVKNIYAGLMALSPLSKFFERRPQLRKLYVFSAINGYQALPSLRNRQVWQLVGNKRLSESTSSLKFASDQYQKQPEVEVDVSGLKVTGFYMFIIGPTILLAFLLYLLSLVNHIIFLSEREENIGVALCFPWLAVMKSKLSQYLTIGSIQFLPAALSIYLVLISELPPRISSLVSLFIFFVFSAVSLTILQKLLYLRSQIERHEA